MKGLMEGIFFCGCLHFLLCGLAPLREKKTAYWRRLNIGHQNKTLCGVFTVHFFWTKSL